MKPEEQRIKIAEACGWTQQEIEELRSEKPYGVTYRLGRPIPDYLNDLNAMHEAEKMLDSGRYKTSYIVKLNDVIGNKYEWSIVHATAAQRAEAFLRTLGL